MYSPSAQMHTMTSESWLRIIENKFGKDYLTEDQKNLLLEQGITALHESLESEET